MEEVKSNPIVKVTATVVASLISAAIIGLAAYAIGNINSSLARIEAGQTAQSVLLGRYDERLQVLERDYERRLAAQQKAAGP